MTSPAVTTFLGVIALATLVMALIQVGAISYMARMARRIEGLLGRVEHDLQPTVERINAFWQSVADRRQPMPEMKRDAEAVIKRLRHTEKDTSIDLSDDNELADAASLYVSLSERLSELGTETRKLEKQRNELKATILHKMGRHQFARLRNCVIETKTTERKGFTVAASSSRSISIKE